MVNHASSGRMKAIEELVRGRDFANQLRYVINGEDGSSSSSAVATNPALAEQLMTKVLMSFTNTLLHLNNPTNSEVSDWINDNPAKSEDSQESNCKSSTIKERRGCYKRRRTSQTWEKESETPADQDGHQWRKYGQKDILNTKYPRNYYRCTHKFDQGCQATKQVQRVQDEPPLYKSTYYGNHTCRNLVNPDIILDPNYPSGSSIILSFDNTLPVPAKKDCPFLSSSSFPSPIVKKECKEEIIPSSSSNDYILSPELIFDNCSSRHVTLSSTLGSDHRDVMSGAFYDSAELDQVFEPFLDF